MSDTQTQDEQSKVPSPEEIAELNKKMTDFWDTQIPVLQKQKDYECLQADIEEARYKRAVMLMRRAELTAPAKDKPKEETKKS